MGVFKSFLFLIYLRFVLSIVSENEYCNPNQLNDNSTIIYEKYGRLVSETASNQVTESGIFPPDRGMLRRIAISESNDGLDSNTFRTGSYGGIWQVDQIQFLETKDISKHAKGLPKIHQKIEEKFGIKWRDVVWQDLRKPLYSAIAGRISLYLKNETIPKDLNAQANYWKKHYNTNLGKGKVQEFIERVNRVEDPCPLEYWGNCTQRCGEIKRDGSANYHCIGGCRKCTGICFECEIGYWGPECKQRCGFNPGEIIQTSRCDGSCDKQSGICKKCDTGFWGLNCKEKCGFISKTGQSGCSGSCDQSNGNCPKCSINFWDEKCDKECHPNCRIYDGKKCDKSSGNCFQCDNGYSGSDCSTHNT